MAGVNLPPVKIYFIKRVGDFDSMRDAASAAPPIRIATRMDKLWDLVARELLVDARIRKITADNFNAGGACQTRLKIMASNAVLSSRNPPSPSCISNSNHIATC